MHKYIPQLDSSAPPPVGVEVGPHWLTVQEAVLRCTELGLPRTPKTVRKWAQRSSELPVGSGDALRYAMAPRIDSERAPNHVKWWVKIGV